MTQAVINQIGGEDALRELVEHFYDLVESEPKGQNIRSLHAQNHGMEHTRAEQFNFLSGFMGGRQHYMEKHGHMNVKDFHAHIPIYLEDAENWLALMDKALSDMGHSGPHVAKLSATFRRVALFLVNDGRVQ